MSVAERGRLKVNIKEHLKQLYDIFRNHTASPYFAQYLTDNDVVDSYDNYNILFFLQLSA